MEYWEREFWGRNPNYTIYFIDLEYCSMVMIHVFSFPSCLSLPIAIEQFHWVLYASLIKIDFHIINICTRVIIYSLHNQSYPYQTMGTIKYFSSAFLLSQSFLWLWTVFFLLSPSELSWIIACWQKSPLRSIVLQCYQSLCTMFS